MNNIEKLLEELKFEVGSMEILKSKEDKVILGSGNLKGDILFIGDDKELYEDENLKVKTGSSGEFLIKLCDIVGLTPDDYYITTLTKCEKNFRDLDEKEKREFKEFLEMQIALINPKIVVALGQDVGELLLGKEVKFLEERGKIEKWKGNIELILTYDADFAKKSRDDGGKRAKVAMEFWGDLKEIKKYISGE